MKLLGLVLVIACLAVAAIVAADEAKPSPAPAKVADSDWTLLRAVSAELIAADERVGRLRAEFELAGQRLRAKSQEQNALVERLAKQASVDLAKCVPNPETQAWVPRQPGASCLKEAPPPPSEAK